MDENKYKNDNLKTQTLTRINSKTAYFKQNRRASALVLNEKEEFTKKQVALTSKNNMERPILFKDNSRQMLKIYKKVRLPGI